MKLYLITYFIYNGIGAGRGPMSDEPEVLFSYTLTRHKPKNWHMDYMYPIRLSGLWPQLLEIDVPESLSFVWVESFYKDESWYKSCYSLTERGLTRNPNTDGIIYNKQIVYLQD